MKELACDVAVIGGGVGGCAAALAAAKQGLKVVLTEETEWIGGQLTQQAVPPDEHPWIEQFGCTRTYREYRNRVRDYYRRNYPLTAEAAARWDLNPGNGSVSRLCHEPRVGLAVLHEMLAPYVSDGRITLMHNVKAIAAETESDYVRSVTVRCSGAPGALSGHALAASPERLGLTAPCFLDATELGDLLPLTGTEYVTGFEAQFDTGEPHAPTESQPDNVQAFTCCFAVEHLPGEDHTLDKPAEYDFWRDYLPELTPAWPGKLFSWVMSHPQTLEPRDLVFDPEGGATAGLNLWTYRRIAACANFSAGERASDLCLVNWPQTDYWLGNLCEVGEEEAAAHLRRAKQLSLSFLYWLQTEAPRPDGGSGWPGLHLRPDVVGTADGLAKYPYVRESRRIRAEVTVTELHVGTDARMEQTGLGREEVRATCFADTVGVGSYRLDLHPSTGGDNYIDFSSLPFQIPLGALIPVRAENLLPACKNLGVTHLTNGCYRLHPVEWNLGEAAGALAAFCHRRDLRPRQVRNTPELRTDFQRELTAQGLELHWPRVTPR
ncbi:MAG: FAD-dependent oxidoreductase [Armatimonadetes bacterium CG2_30_66_41]|nr:MAG: FAD-dependent oxidoreductase [Armatimonadetes bacterium CG2_30_66_41]